MEISSSYPGERFSSFDRKICFSFANDKYFDQSHSSEIKKKLNTKTLRGDLTVSDYT